jgi:selenocysteine lyase/cysteine desulfurase
MQTPTRRVFIGAGLAGGAALVAGCSDDDPSSEPGASASGAPDPRVWDPQDWDSIRAQFQLDPELAQFAAFVLSPHTKLLDAAIADHRERLGRDTEDALLTGQASEQAVRDAAAAFAGGDPSQYALTDSTTMGIATMYGGLTLRAGDEVLTTTHDFFSTEDALRLVGLRTGAKVTRVDLYDDPAAATVDDMTKRLLDAVTPKTRVVALTWVHSSTGVRVPVQEIAAGLPDDVTLCVDGVHGFAAVDVDLPDLGCDFLATGTHKWLFGPRGTGILWAGDWEPLTELIPSFSGPDGPARLTAGGYKAFEHQWAVKDAFEFQQSIGRARVVERTVEQASQLKDGLSGIDGLTLVTPADPAISAGIVCVDVAGMPPANAVQELRTRGVVASATPYQRSYLRLGPSIATSPEQVDQAITALQEIVES